MTYTYGFIGQSITYPVLRFCTPLVIIIFTIFKHFLKSITVYLSTPHAAL